MLREAHTTLEGRDFLAAQRLAEGVLSHQPDSGEALWIAAQAAAGRDRPVQTISFCDRIPNDGSEQAAAARMLAGQVLLTRRFQAGEAERRFRQVLERQPDHLAANVALADLLGAESRRYEAIPHILALFSQDRVRLDHLQLLHIQGWAMQNDQWVELLERCHATAPNDPGPCLALAWHLDRAKEPGRVRALLEAAAVAAPPMAEAQARLGEYYLGIGSQEDFVAWLDRFPPESLSHPQVWAVLGAWARQQDQTEAAARCFWEVVRLEPNHRAANYQLSRILIELEQASLAAPFADRALRLQQLQDAIDVVFHSKPESLELMAQVVEQLESLGRLWEAWGWSHVALQFKPNEPWAQEAHHRLKGTLKGSPLTLPEANPALQVDLSSYPLPNKVQDPSLRQSSQPQLEIAAVRFEDRAASVGLRFTYFSGGRAVSEGKRMYEFPGGAAAVLDYDLDGWPDIHLTQGCAWPPDETQSEHLDRLYRNTGAGQFEEVTLHAGIFENRYSQGATVGDFDNDGFPDLYVANIGLNRLYRNNGDGTFSDATASIDRDAGQWTTSCMMADLNGDGLPEIYAVNYLEADDVFERVCPHGDGTPRMCMPFHFPAATDQLYLNLGDGRFRDVTKESGADVPDGKGLGVVAGDFFRQGRLSLFVANDTTPNFFLVNRTGTDGRLAFTENALELGVALNEAGQAEGCMGVAVGDADEDGRLDLFVTNFLNESNTLYLQRESGFFVDHTRRSGLLEPSLPMLGFGAQFVDGDLDGRLDLLTVNGHVDDVRAFGLPYQMPPQYFHNAGLGRFIEGRPEILGPYFQGRHLGRGLARIDWNRDGREDAVVSNLDGPVALLTNVSPSSGHWLALVLHGVHSSRDAIGTTVVLRAGDRVLIRQLTAGDGYHASNERRIVFGLAAQTRVDHVEIHWPSGHIQSLRDLASDQELIVIESGITAASAHSASRRLTQTALETATPGNH